jgi:uncharacterized protein
MEQLSPGNVFRKPLISILSTLLFFFIGFQVLGSFLGALVAYPFFPGTSQEYLQAFSNPTAFVHFRLSLLIIQAVGATVGMIVLPYYFLKIQDRTLASYFSTPFFQPIFIISVLVIVFMGFNSFFIQWNQEIHLPFGIEEWARPLEDKLAETTKFLTELNSIPELVLAFIAIAIIPAIGEEIIFRGLIQNDFYRATRNAHVAIWMSAFLFSAIHFQFYGFVPRLFLGALFGYLYFWSGNLWMPVLAHFVNNGFTLLTLILYQKKTIDVDLEKIQPSVFHVMISMIFSAFLLYAYKNFFNKLPKSDIPD